jgi:hypothetical protein
MHIYHSVIVNIVQKIIAFLYICAYICHIYLYDDELFMLIMNRLYFYKYTYFPLTSGKNSKRNLKKIF